MLKSEGGGEGKIGKSGPTVGSVEARQLDPGSVNPDRLDDQFERCFFPGRRRIGRIRQPSWVSDLTLFGRRLGGGRQQIGSDEEPGPQEVDGVKVDAGEVGTDPCRGGETGDATVFSRLADENIGKTQVDGLAVEARFVELEPGGAEVPVRLEPRHSRQIEGEATVADGEGVGEKSELREVEWLRGDIVFYCGIGRETCRWRRGQGGEDGVVDHDIGSAEDDGAESACLPQVAEPVGDDRLWD